MTRDTIPGLGDMQDLISTEIERWLSSCERDPLAPVHRWGLSPRGKLLRPVLVLQSAATVSGPREQVLPRGQLLPVAVGIELAHVASLAHDDVIDGDAMRRGRASVPSRFGTAHAVLGGDALFFALVQSLAVCHQHGATAEAVVEAVRIVGDSGRDLSAGVAMELMLSGCGQGLPFGGASGTTAYVEMVRLKTAALMSGACQIGAVLVGGCPQEVAALGKFGEALGIAFQIGDDLLPYEPGPISAAKPVDSDLRNLRPALPLMLAVDSANPLDRTRLASGDMRWDEVRALVRDSGAVLRARELRDEYVGRALTALNALPATEHRRHLAALVDYALGGG
ncbi:polyprenyl synthetase family protein [Streptomyces netropsis]|uniref:Geranylgeranyl diphosphate synthase type I n=1 Tax=Streptomyces netropsis TaxID=55404 RepID=A0A7W7LFM1_STRNE|nr:polyprenyl synthetase family protein [Streptomyces netropsis]MBB4889027.1 geranylgeranyl diphosphate synthase type I [Streptomyces netropsis]GGR10915.1 serralysin [Streptomyces netropsis]